MIRTYRTLLKLCLVSAVFWGLLSNAMAQDSSNPSGTVTVTATSAALGVGWSWGTGTLTLVNGKQYHFKVSGLDVVAVGFKQATAVGNVYNLKSIKDFEGSKWLQQRRALSGVVWGQGRCGMTREWSLIYQG